MELNRISVKFPVKDPAALHAEKIVPLFHRWIQEHAVEGAPVDVANYDHVPDGPGVMLVGHEGDYAIDFMDGKPQFMYQRKRAMSGGVGERLRLALRVGLTALKTLVDNPAPHGPLAFNLGELNISLIDRLHAPNNEATWTKVRGEIEAVAREVYGLDAKVAWLGGDSRGNFNVRVTSTGATDISGMLDKLSATVNS